MKLKPTNKEWLLTWAFSLIICLSTLGSYEFYLKNKGFSASIENNNDLWSWYREKVSNTKNSLVIVGASRSQLDLSMNYLRDNFLNYTVTQLSVNGHYPLATLKALADDASFNGIVIASINAQALEPVYFDMQQPQNHYYLNNATLYKSLDAFLTAKIQSNLRLLHPLLGLRQVVEYYDVNKKFQSAFYTTAHLDQSVSANYSLTNVENLYNHFVHSKKQNYLNQPPTEPVKWAENINLLIQYNQAIVDRGGQVVLVRFPTYKGHWELDEAYYPRELYWDKIEENTDLLTVHFKDVEGLDQFDSPDSSHLDQKDSQQFTQLLFDELLKRSYIESK